MKTQYSLQQLAERITKRAETKEDFIADTRSMNYLSERNELMLGNGRSFAVNDHAHSQIATHTDIPARYYARMREQAPDLLAKNIHEWFTRYPSNRMVRTLDGNARAFLSDKYSRMDDDVFANVVLPAIYETPGAEVRSCGMTDTKTTIKFVSRKFERELKKVGDVVRFGISFFNSEVGCGRIGGALFAEQLRCTNGMTIEDEMFASTHVGARHTKRDLGEIFKLDTIKADGQATILKLRDFARELLTDRFIDHQVERMNGLIDRKIEEPVKAVEQLAKQHSFAELVKNDVLKHLIEGGDLTMWGLQNAVTRAAEDQDNYDDACKLEVIGGRMLALAA